MLEAFFFFFFFFPPSLSLFLPPELFLLLIMALDLDDLSISPSKMLYHLVGGGSAW